MSTDDKDFASIVLMPLRAFIDSDGAAMSNNDLNPILEMALAMYADEPCRICGRLLTMDDIKAGAVFAGYSDDNKSRAAHETCWNNANAIFGQKAGSHE